MAIYKLGESTFEKLRETTFGNEGIKEREDIQRLLKESIDVISPDSLIIAEEFSSWVGSQRRIDLLAIDHDANLVVIELKRTQDGGHMDLQAIRYASMISTMTMTRAIEVFSEYLDEPRSEAEEKILSFLGWAEVNEEDFANDVRIVLASAEFSRELTSSVLWLNEKGLDIRCIKIKPYHSAEGVLVNVEQVIPLPEAEEYQIGIREKKQKQQSERISNRDTTRRDLVINGKSFEDMPKRRIILEVMRAAVENGASIEALRLGLPPSKWVSVEGELSSKDFVQEADQLDLNHKFDPPRYFTKDDELFHQNGNTYALSKMWGRGTQSHVERIAEQFGLQVSVEW